MSTAAITPDGRRVISGSGGSTYELKLWDLSSGALCLTLAGHEGDVTAVAASPDGRHVLSASRDRTLRLWDLENRICRALIPMEIAPMAIAMAPDGRTVVVGDRIGNLHYLEIHVDSGVVGLARGAAASPGGQQD